MSLPPDHPRIILLASVWMESVFYGIFCGVFAASVYVHFKLRSSANTHSTIMTAVGALMFFVATLHTALNWYRLDMGYTGAPREILGTPATQGFGGPELFLNNLAVWHRLVKDTLWVSQELLGHIVGIYRCWVVWDHQFQYIGVSVLIFIASIVSGCKPLSLYFSAPLGIFDPNLLKWITIFYSLAVAQNIITTGLIGFRIWKTKRDAGLDQTLEDDSDRLSFIRILIESAALQVVAETILLVLYIQKTNAQIILVECITSLVGITFTAMTIRISLNLQGALERVTGLARPATTLFTLTHHGSTIKGSNPGSDIRKTRGDGLSMDMDMDEGSIGLNQIHELKSHHRREMDDSP